MSRTGLWLVAISVVAAAEVLAAPSQGLLGAPQPDAPFVSPVPPAPRSPTTADASPSAEPLDAELSNQSGDDDAAAGDGEIVVVEQKIEVTPGSAQSVSEEQLTRHESDDVHKILLAVPGVYVREEEGYGLRPNIGMRGVSSERSSKVALMEDGILIAPAPYSAPAAYYFPLVTRMRSVDVSKGPAAILYGPNTVGGAVDLRARQIPFEREAAVDGAVGSDAYRKLHMWYGDRWRHGGLLIEGVSLGSDGFKELDGGGDTGFVRNEVIARGRVNSNPDKVEYHQVDLSVGYSTEGSNETYTGLTDADFEVNPYRRYRATHLDRMEWDRLALRLRHSYTPVGGIEITSTAYHHRFDRAWRKLNGFVAGRTLEEVLGAPDAGSNRLFYQLLTGESDSTSSSEALLLGTNDRAFVSEGVQSEAIIERSLVNMSHRLRTGLRIHHDSALREHSEESYLMQSGQLVADGAGERMTRDATGSATALSLWLQDQATRGRLTVTAGARTELIASRSEDHMDPTNDQSERYAAVLPGGGVFYRLADWAGLLAGVHRGFVPVAPGQGDQARPEYSINYEAGSRFASPWGTAELIGFFNDYSNLKGTCSLSSGCTDAQIEDEFDGGAVNIWGAEAATRGEVRLSEGLWLPVMASYTFTQSSFRSSFMSDNPAWGDVAVGDEVPYLPTHQLAGQLAVRGRHFEVGAAVRHLSAMRDVAGQGEPAPGETTDANTVMDLAAHGYFGSYGELYLTVDNLLDEAAVVARRPYGARPGKPRTFTVGYKGQF